MDIINSILSFVLYFILDSLVIQLVYTLTDTEIRKKWQTSALIGLNGIIIVIALNRQYIENIGNISIILKRVILICFIIGRFFLYSAVFKKVSKQVLWVFLTTFATNQIYSNITKKITDSLYRVDLAYLIEIVFLAFAFFYIKKNKKEEIYKRIISSLPQKLYTLVLIILLIASIFVAAALRDDSGSIIQYFLLTYCAAETVRWPASLYGRKSWKIIAASSSTAMIRPMTLTPPAKILPIWKTISAAT